MPEPTSDGPPPIDQRLGRPDWPAVAGYAIIFLAALLPLQGIALYTALNYFNRWAYTDPLFALIALGNAAALRRDSTRPVIPLHLISGAAIVVVTGAGYGWWHSLNQAPGEDDYLSGITFVISFFVIGAFALLKMATSLAARCRHG